MSSKLEDIGYNSWLHSQADIDQISDHEISRVISVHKNSYMITKGYDDVFAELSGSLFYSASSSLDLPTTGDWVYADFYDDDSHAIIHGVMPRKTLLKRKAAGKSVDFQLIAANIDTAFIVQSADYDFNLRRLERYLVMVNESQIIPIILLSKCDLVSQSKIEEIKESILKIAPNITILAFSSLNGDNINKIKHSLLKGHTYCLIGSSGVGKTTLLNNLLGSDQLKTQSISKKDNKGQHTTTSRELMQISNGALFVDTPGMRELGNISIDIGLDETFSEILELAKHCKFSDCSHSNEKNCAILMAIEKGELAEERYNNYMKMKNESAFNEMSYFEKRTKDKNFGKLIKSVQKIKKERHNK